MDTYLQIQNGEINQNEDGCEKKKCSELEGNRCNVFENRHFAIVLTKEKIGNLVGYGGDAGGCGCANYSFGH